MRKLFVFFVLGLIVVVVSCSRMSNHIGRQNVALTPNWLELDDNPNDVVARTVSMDNDKEAIVYEAMLDGEVVGVATRVRGRGYRGPIDIGVYFDSAMNIKQVVLLKHRETRGKWVARSGHLNQYLGVGLSNKLRYGIEVDAVSGATHTSKYVLKIVKQARSVIRAYLKMTGKE